jgi:hypothetical protein
VIQFFKIGITSKKANKKIMKFNKKITQKNKHKQLGLTYETHDLSHDLKNMIIER